MRKNNLMKLVTLLCFIMPAMVIALPTIKDVETGEVNTFQPDSSSLLVQASDKTIVNFESFDIATHESVQFIQPDANAVLLNRVVGQDPSNILGSMKSNGKVFLVNPNGVYFGVDSKVDMGSLVASTLNISNEDFMTGDYQFASSGKEGKIVNLGRLSAPEGTIALISSQIENEGIISAQAGKVVLASGEKVVLDFHGDKLMNFIVDSKVIVTEGIVEMRASTASDLINEVINDEGVVKGTTLVVENGSIRITDGAVIEASEIAVCGKENTEIYVEGRLDASSYQTGNTGGNISIYGENIFVGQAKILACGDAMGGEIKIGGNYYGQDSVFNAKTVILSEESVISADAYFKGEGGKVCVWSDDATEVNGKISARGGKFGGDGGFVETSSMSFVGSQKAIVDTEAVNGNIGVWSIDPAHIIIKKGGRDKLSTAKSGNDSFSTRVIDPDVFKNAKSKVMLRALTDGGTITIEEGSHICLPHGKGLAFEVSKSSGTIYLEDDSSIETCGGEVLFDGPVYLRGKTDIMTTYENAIGGNIIFTSAVDGNRQKSDLNLDAGMKGIVKFNSSVGTLEALGGLNIDAGEVNLSADIRTYNKNMNFNAPISLQDDITMDSTRGGIGGGDVIFNDSINGNYVLTVVAGNGTIYQNGDIGTIVPLYRFATKAANTITGGCVCTDGGTQIYESNITLTANTAHTDNGVDGIYYIGTINGAFTLDATAPIGKVHFYGAVGGGTPINSLTVIASEIQQDLGVTLADGEDVSYSANKQILLAGDITVTDTDATAPELGLITINDPITVTGAITLSVEAGTCTLNGANGATGNLTISDTGAGIAVLQNNPFHLDDLTVTTTTVTIAATTAIIAEGNVSIGQTSGATGASCDITTHGGNVSFTGTTTQTGDISTNGGDITFDEAITASTGDFNTLGGTITFTGALTAGSGNYNTSGGHIYFVGAVTDAAGNYNTGGGDITFTGAVAAYVGVVNTYGGNFTASNTFALTAGTDPLIISADGGAIAFANTVGGAAPLRLYTSEVGNVSFANAVSAITELSIKCGNLSATISGTISVAGALELEAVSTSIASAALTVTADSIVKGPVELGVVAGTFTITHSNVNFYFLGSETTIDADGTNDISLEMVGGTGTVEFDGALGAHEALEDLDVTAGKLLIASDIYIAPTTGGDAVSLTCPVLFIGNSLISIQGTGVTGFTASTTVDGPYEVRVVADGAITFSGAIGSLYPLKWFELTSSETGTIALDGASSITSGKQVYNNAVTIGAGYTFTDTAEGIYFASTLDGTQTCTVNARSGKVTFVGAIGSGVGTEIDTFAVNAGEIEQLSSLELTTDKSVTYAGSTSSVIAGNITCIGTGGMTFTYPITIVGNLDFTLATSGTAVFNGVVGGAGDLRVAQTATCTTTLQTNSIDLYAFEAATTTVTHSVPILAKGAVTLGMATSAVTSTSDIITQGGDVTLQGTTVAYTGDIISNSGNIDVTGTTLTMGGNFISGSGNIDINSAVTLLTHSIFDVGGGDLTFDSTVNGAFNLSVSGTETGSATFTGACGGTLKVLKAEVGNITFSSTCTTDNANITLIGSNAISFGGDVGSGGGNIVVRGPSTITGATEFDSVGGNLSFLGNESKIDGAFALTLTSTSITTVEGALGFTAAIAGLTHTAGGNLRLGADIRSTGAIALNSPILLTSNSNIYASSTITTAATNGTIDGPFDLVMETTGNNNLVIGIAATIGGTIPLNSLHTRADGTGVITMGGEVHTRH
jgi:filamentous hemagglutinin family protein